LTPLNQRMHGWDVCCTPEGFTEFARLHTRGVISIATLVLSPDGNYIIHIKTHIEVGATEVYLCAGGYQYVLSVIPADDSDDCADTASDEDESSSDEDIPGPSTPVHVPRRGVTDWKDPASGLFYGQANMDQLDMEPSQSGW